jgi:hypothetical protein
MGGTGKLILFRSILLIDDKLDGLNAVDVAVKGKDVILGKGGGGKFGGPGIENLFTHNVSV